MSVNKLIAGRHSCVGRFSGSQENPTHEMPTRLDKAAMLVYVGTFESMDGPVEITEEMIDKLMANHNAKIESYERAGTLEAAYFASMPPIQLDHSTSARDTVGRVVGKLTKGEFIRPDGVPVSSLLCDRAVILGQKNVEHVLDGRWSNISIGADLELCTLNELSITPFPAAPHAAMLKNGTKLSEGEKMETKEEMKARHLAEKEALAGAQGEELKSKKLEEVKSKHEDQLKALQDKHSEELKKLGVDTSEGKTWVEKEGDELSKEDAPPAKEGDETKKEGDALAKRMSAAKPKIVALAKKINTGMAASRLAAKKSMIQARVSRLRASAKMTPAEQKKVNLSELAAKSEAELNSFFEGYELREDVVDTRFHGTTKALSLAKLERLSSSRRLARLEAEGRADMGLPMTDDQRKELAESTLPPSAPREAAMEADDMMKHLAGLLGEHQSKDAIMAHVKSMMEQKHLAEMPADAAEGSEKQMSGLVKDFNKLQTEFQDLTAMVGDAFGIQQAELE